MSARLRRGSTPARLTLLQLQARLIHPLVSASGADCSHPVIDTELLASAKRDHTDRQAFPLLFSADVARSIAVGGRARTRKRRLEELRCELAQLGVRP